jgi:hypothetical protein
MTCNQFLGSQIADQHTLGVWLNGYVNGERGKKLIDPLSPGHISLGPLLREPQRCFWTLPALDRYSV